MCNNTGNNARFEIISSRNGGRYVIGRAVRSRTYIADRKKGALIFDTRSEDSKEYSPAKVAAVMLMGVIGAVYILVSLKKGMQRKKTVKLQAKEIKRLEKLCKDVAEYDAR